MLDVKTQELEKVGRGQKSLEAEDSKAKAQVRLQCRRNREELLDRLFRRLLMAIIKLLYNI
jgi:hypothetical protein